MIANRKRPCIKILILFLCGVLNSLSVCAASRPNVLIIVADDLGYSDIGSYGGEIRTPNLDALANNGLRFTQFYNTARCWPSRSALLTGFYAQHIGRDALTGSPLGNGTRPAWAPLLPAMLKSNGYRSYHSGKWHIDGTPIEGGFDRSYYPESSAGYFDVQKYTEDGKARSPIGPESGYYSTIAVADHAIEHLQDHAKNHPDRPFFQYVAFFAPHFPLHALPEDIARYRGHYDKGWDRLRKERWKKLRKIGMVRSAPAPIERGIGPPYHLPEDLKKLGPDEVNRPVNWDSLSDRQRRFQSTKMEAHAAMIDRMDHEIGRVLDQLKKMRAFDNTLILFVSDNGASAEIMLLGRTHDPHAPAGSAPTFLALGPGWSSAANTPFRRHKVWVHEGGIATPFIAHWPLGIVARGELRFVPGHLIDVVPTILDLAATPAPKTWRGIAVPPAPGRSLVPAFAKDGTVSRDYIWWLHEGNRALRMGDWKIVSAPDRSTWDFNKILNEPAYAAARMADALNAPWELYNLKDDRAELDNLASQYPDRVRDMVRVWTKEYENALTLAAQ